jgi:alcohol dehydrogenase/L-iditol 2-dehydrogenase
LIGGVWPLDEWEQAFQSMHDGRIVKAVLQP